LDLTHAINQESTTDQYHYAYTDMSSTQGLDRFAICAALIDPADSSHDFIETVLRNAGFNLRLLSNPAQAMAFLGNGGNEKRSRDNGSRNRVQLK
jgi:hypothetical protein